MLNIFLQHEAFLQKAADAKLKSSERLLYEVLLWKANSVKWKDPFGLSIREIRGATGLCFSTIVTARKGLVEKGFLTVSPAKSERESYLFHIIRLYEQQPKESQEQAVARQEREQEDDATAEAIMSSRHPTERELLNQMMVFGFTKLQAAERIDRSVDITRQMAAKTKKRMQDGQSGKQDFLNHPDSYFDSIANPLYERCGKTVAESNQLSQERQAAQEQQIDSYIPPTAENYNDMMATSF